MGRLVQAVSVLIGLLGLLGIMLSMRAESDKAKIALMSVGSVLITVSVIGTFVGVVLGGQL